MAAARTKRRKCKTGFIPSSIVPEVCNTCGQLRHEHAVRRMRAIITITEHEAGEDRFNATIHFEPSIKTMSKESRERNAVVMAAWAAWQQLRRDKRGVITLTDA